MDTLKLENEFASINQVVISSQRLYRFLDLDDGFDIFQDVLVSDSQALIVVISTSWTVEYLLDLVRPSTLTVVKLSSNTCRATATVLSCGHYADGRQ